jgi:hypothetical protein
VENQDGREVRIPVTKHILVAKFGPESTDARLLLKKSLRNPKDSEWLVKPPVMPAPKVWEQFKVARSSAELVQALNAMEEHIPEADLGLLRPLFKAAREYAADIFNAKAHLLHYPGSDRPGSDNKRIDFFAKILGGVALGLSPLTSTKRLAWWSPTISLYSSELSRQRKKK